METKNKSRIMAARTHDDNSSAAESALSMPARSAEVQRKTRETSVAVALRIDGSGRGEIGTGVPFLDHMLESFARHGFFDLRVEATGDLHIDDHHTVEDVGIVLGRAFRQALGDRSGIRRFGSATVPLDEALCTAVVDISGRAFLAYNLEFREERVGNFQTILVHDFMKGMSDETGMNLHLNLHAGRNPHHIVEAAFKALARAMDQATSVEPRLSGVLSTKGTLS
ncbi:MAG TPA: imidazoleglycerol-phosphate dehydratase HisB [Candidatus Binataceae bacterium]|jgi:imidazoleglycerol-phosphate dehydratase|nr:imidazoleglycerol-phosphate dehydratase HisB [Candidatus Binataceae bacterium]